MAAAARLPASQIARIAVLCSLVLLTACKTELFASLPEGEANEVVGLLMQAGMSAAKSSTKEGNSSVTVEEKDFARAVALLRQHGHPRRQFQTIGDVFQQGGLVASPMQERARFLWALGQELSSTISQIDGVLTARVQVVLPDNDLLRKEPSPSSASVFIRHDSRSQASKLVPQIRALVSGSVEGLSYDKVSVILIPVEADELPPAAIADAPQEHLGPAIGLSAVVLILGGLFIARSRLMPLFRATKISAAE